MKKYRRACLMNHSVCFILSQNNLVYSSYTTRQRPVFVGRQSDNTHLLAPPELTNIFYIGRLMYSNCPNCRPCAQLGRRVASTHYS